MKSKKENKTSKILEKKRNKLNIENSKSLDNKNFICNKNDKDCWHRYSSAMGDCI
jgi:hypothetical protein